MLDTVIANKMISRVNVINKQIINMKYRDKD